MAEQRLNQRKGLMTQTIRRARRTSQVLICHLPPPPQLLLLLLNAALAWELTGTVVLFPEPCLYSTVASALQALPCIYEHSWGPMRRRGL